MFQNEYNFGILLIEVLPTYSVNLDEFNKSNRTATIDNFVKKEPLFESLTFVFCVVIANLDCVTIMPVAMAYCWVIIKS